MTHKAVVVFSVVVSLLVAAAVLAQSTESYTLRDAVGEKAYPAAPRLARQVTIAAAVTLDTITRAMPEKVAEMERWNASGNVPVRNGIGRALADPVKVQLAGAAVAAKVGPVPLGRGVVAATARGLTWSGNVKVDGAGRLRLHLSDVKIPDGAVLWVYGGDDSTAFSKELIDPDGGLWTPSAWGDTIHLEIEVPSGAAASFSIDQVLELIDEERAAPSQKPVPNDTPSCLVDITCVTSTPLPLTDVSHAIAHLEYVVGGSGFVCTGGLINDKPSSHGSPAYLITANHCISSQSAASSLQAFWDWKFASCVSTTVPPLSSVPKSNGSTLLTTTDKSSGSDVTLLRLNSIPASRILLGWTTDPAAIAAGTLLYRVSHPAPSGFGSQPQMYSSTAVTSTGPRCTTLPTTNFIYSSNLTGGTYGGSSGSPVMISTGQIVGQLYGACGTDPEAGCDPAQLKVDGKFAASYASLKPFIDPGTSVGCTPSSTVVCLNNSRFSVRIDWKTGGQSGQGQAIKYTDASALFWFFGPDNIEVLLKVLNACSLSNTYWVFSAATTDVEYTIFVTDTASGKTKTYFHAGGSAAPAITDTSAFATCP
jgi:hypothetical protein